VKRIIEELKDKGKIDRNFEIGMRIQSIDEGIAKYYHLTVQKELLLQRYPGTPADRGGMKLEI